eukprot:TRINITY_DN18415_c0_g1_i1.p1 TRINITY_DN18415_c0_g1~~TRINITY_DN18415_c0_g1_i1.p1  ORF type:complete len:485 (-),score=99.61 TRINITY_DN18415_c0_g1_i1:76-1437(-)
MALRDRRRMPSLNLALTLPGNGNGAAGNGEEAAEENAVDPDAEAFAANYEFIRSLGFGTTAVVRLASRRSDGHEVAIKCVDSRDAEEVAALREEYELLRGLRHEHIARVEALYVTRTGARMCMEFCTDGSLEQAVSRLGAFGLERSRDLTRQLLSALNFLNGRRIVHRDIKPANILLTCQTTALRLSDFNSAKQIGEGADAMLSHRGTPEYAAPEVRFGQEWNERIDVWCCGLSIYYMLNAKMPFSSSDAGLTSTLLEGRLPPISWIPTADLPLRDLVLQCLTVDYRDRPPAMVLLMHPAINLGKTYNRSVSDGHGSLSAALLEEAGLEQRSATWADTGDCASSSADALSGAQSDFGVGLDAMAPPGFQAYVRRTSAPSVCPLTSNMLPRLMDGSRRRSEELAGPILPGRYVEHRDGKEHLMFLASGKMANRQAMQSAAEAAASEDASFSSSH